MMRKYGKPSGPIFKHKTDFFTENKEKLAEFQGLAEEYRKQPRRLLCKNCDSVLGECDFVTHDIQYSFCDICGHLNGFYEDTEDYCKKLYLEDDGKAYAENYDAKSKAIYRSRVEDIYRPKADFLFEALEEIGESPSSMSYADLGAGAGFFVSALLMAGAERVTGFEVSGRLVNMAREMTGLEVIERLGMGDTARAAAGADAEVISMIGVLEHLRHPRAVLQAIQGNLVVRYLFLSVPLFSPSVFFEMTAHDVMPRQLGQDHTHLYTESSIDYLCREFHFERLAEWWFGTDMMDLYRTVWVRLMGLPHSEKTAGMWERFFGPAMDEMQLALDRRHVCSEVHMLLRTRK